MLLYVIKDIKTDEYFAKRCTKTGWYTTDLRIARTYSDYNKAEQVMRAGDHHVSYPGGRALVVSSVTLT